jgi:hypothetical protein
LAKIQIAEDLLVDDGVRTRLIAGRRRTDGEIVFPLPGGSERDQFEPPKAALRGPGRP